MESVCDEREVTSFPFQEYAEKLKPIVFLLVSARKGIWPVKLRTRTACGENPGGSWLTWLMWKKWPLRDACWVVGRRCQCMVTAIAMAYLRKYFGQRGAVHLYRIRLDELTPHDAVAADGDVRVGLVPCQSRRDVVADDDERVLEIAWLARHCCH